MMENKHAGLLIIGISIVVAIIVFIFNSAISNIASAGCGHSTCTMHDAMLVQTWISLSVVAIIFIIGIVIFLTKPKEKIVIKKVKEKKKKASYKGLDKEEKKIVNILIRENKAMFQKTLMEELEIGKVKMTRLLDKLEAKQIIERKRRGMNNIVVLRD